MREIVDGVASAILTRGLAAAVSSLTHRLPLVVRIEATPLRLDPGIEIAAGQYLDASGALTDDGFRSGRVGGRVHTGIRDRGHASCTN